MSAAFSVTIWKSFALLRLPVDLVDADLLVDCGNYQRSESEPLPVHCCIREVAGAAGGTTGQRSLEGIGNLGNKFS